MPTLMSVLLHAARALDAAHFSYTTSDGTTTTLVDAQLAAQGWAASDWVAGYVLFPESGQARRITAYTPATGTVTFTPDVPAILENTPYVLISNRYPLPIFLDKLAEVQRQSADSVSAITLTTVANQREYLLARNVTQRVRQVWLSSLPSAPWNETPVTEYVIDYATSSIILNEAPPPDRRLRLVLVGQGGTMMPLVSSGGQYDLSPEITNELADDWLGTETALAVARWRLGQPGVDAQEATQRVNDLMRRAAEAKRRRLIGTPTTHPIFPPNLDKRIRY